MAIILHQPLLFLISFNVVDEKFPILNDWFEEELELFTQGNSSYWIFLVLFFNWGTQIFHRFSADLLPQTDKISHLPFKAFVAFLDLHFFFFWQYYVINLQKLLHCFVVLYSFFCVLEVIFFVQQVEIRLRYANHSLFFGFSEKSKQMVKIEALLILQEFVQAVIVDCILVQVGVCILYLCFVILDCFYCCYIRERVPLLSQTSKFLISNLVSVD